MSHHFQLDTRLAADTLPVMDLPLSRVLLMNDQRYPWVILVPRLPAIREWTDLAIADGERLWRESLWTCEVMQALFTGDKLNVAALGNVVEQMHVHHVLRNRNDPAWPGPVWGHSPAEPYFAEEAEKRLRQLREAFSAKIA